MTTFFNKIIDTVTSATQNAKAGKKLALGATQHAEDQTADKQSFHSVFKSAQSQVKKPVEKNDTTDKTPKSASKKSADKSAKADEKVTAETQETEKQTASEKPGRPEKSGKAKQGKSTASIDQSEKPAIDESQTETIDKEVSPETEQELLSASLDTEAEQTTNETTAVEAGINNPQALALALQFQITQTPEPLPANGNAAIAPVQDNAVTEISTPAQARVSTSVQAEAANTQNVAPPANSTASFDNTLTQAATSNANGSIQLDASSWQLQPSSTEDLQSLEIPTKQLPVDDSATSNVTNEMLPSPKAIIQNAIASGQAEIETLPNDHTIQGNNQVNTPSKLTNLDTPKADDSLGKDNTNALSNQASTQNVADTQQTETPDSPTKATPLAPVPMVAIQIKDTAETAGINQDSNEVEIKPLSPNTQETDTTENISSISAPVTSENNASSNQQHSEDSSQADSSPESKVDAEAPKKPGKANKAQSSSPITHTDKKSVEKPFMAESNETIISKESIQQTSNTPNGAGANTSTDVTMQNISNSAVPVKENAAVNIKDLLTFQANGGEAIDQVNSGIQEGLRVNRPEIVIKLSPENMGDVNVKLSTNAQQQLTARLIASNPETQETLHQQLHQLKQSLESQGIHVEHLTVSVATKADNSGQSDQSNAQNQSGNQDDNRQQQSSSQQSFQQQQQQAQNLYQQFNQNNGNKFATAPWLRQANNGSEVGSGTQIQPAASKPEPQHNPNGSISVFA